MRKPASPNALPAVPPESAARRKPTMTDIARVAGVSQTSVSLILNRMPGARIAEATRLRVLEIAREAGYELPRRPYAPETERNVIAYLVDEISTSPHPVVSFDGARDAAWERGYIVSAHATRSDAQLEATTIAAVRRDPAVLGVIYSTIFTRKVAPPAALRDLPTVLLNCHADRRWPAVVPGEIAGGFNATRYLLDKGHRRIGFINGESWMEAAEDRLEGYRRALAQAGVAFDAALVRNGDWLPLKGYELALELLRQADAPTALFCGNDLMAMGALEAAAKLGLSTPQDISILGYDDQELARYTHPPLSTLVLPNYEMGRRAAELLIDIATGARTRPVRIEVEGALVERLSVLSADMAPAMSEGKRHG